VRQFVSYCKRVGKLMRNKRLHGSPSYRQRDTKKREANSLHQTSSLSSKVVVHVSASSQYEANVELCLNVFIIILFCNFIVHVKRKLLRHEKVSSEGT